MKKLLILLAMGVFFIPALTFSEESAVIPAIPHLINYQGMLTDNSGNPLTGSFDIIFRIYNDASAGTKRWEETQSGVSVTNGLFNVILGSVTPIDLSFTEEYWLDITVGAEHMPSRLKFTSAGYAYRAQKSDTAAYAISGGSYSHNHDADYVNVNGPDSIRGISSDEMFKVENYGNGDGIYIYTPYPSIGDGIRIDSAGDNGIEIQNVKTNGVWMDDIHSDGIHMTDVDKYGIYMDGVGWDGIHIGKTGWAGISLNGAAYNAIHVDSAGDNGLYVKKADNGVYIDYPSLDGLYIHKTGRRGITIDSSANSYNAIYIGHAGVSGLEVNDAGAYGIHAHGDLGNVLESESRNYYGLVVHSYKDSSNYNGLYVYGTTFSTGGWSSKLSGSSGDVPGFSVVSRDMEIITSGMGTLVNGQAQINFEREFQEAISPEVPIRVVVTAQGAPSALLYVDNKSTQGFAVKSLEIPNLSLKSENISFDWIAIARQKGYEQRPEVIIPSEDETRAKELKSPEEIRAEELKRQEKSRVHELHRQEMMEKQAQREAERKESEKGEEK